MNWPKFLLVCFPLSVAVGINESREESKAKKMKMEVMLELFEIYGGLSKTMRFTFG